MRPISCLSVEVNDIPSAPGRLRLVLSFLNIDRGNRSLRIHLISNRMLGFGPIECIPLLVALAGAQLEPFFLKIGDVTTTSDLAKKRRPDQ